MRRLTIGGAGQPMTGAVRRTMALGALGGQGLDHGGGFVFPPFRVKNGTLLKPVFRPKAGRADRGKPIHGQVMRLHAPINAWFAASIP
jgi:hypothetical protein